jgi:hypothetical protein
MEEENRKRPLADVMDVQPPSTANLDQPLGPRINVKPGFCHGVPQRIGWGIFVEQLCCAILVNGLNLRILYGSGRQRAGDKSMT